MSPAEPASVKAYLDSLPEDRRKALSAIRKVIRENLDGEYKEGIQYRMIGYFVPHKVYPPGYHCDPKQPLPYVGLASQKSHIGIYLFCVYLTEDLHRWFTEAWKATGKRLDMGKACVRVKKLEDVPLDVLGELIRRTPAQTMIDHYEDSLAAANDARDARRAAKKKTTKKAAKKATKKKVSPAKGKKVTKKKATKKKSSKKKAAKRGASR